MALIVLVGWVSVACISMFPVLTLCGWWLVVGGWCIQGYNINKTTLPEKLFLAWVRWLCAFSMKLFKIFLVYYIFNLDKFKVC